MDTQPTEVVEETKKPVEPEDKPNGRSTSASREELLAKMRRKKTEMHWSRMSRHARDIEIERIEDRLEEKISGKERMILKDKLAMLDEIDEKEMQSSGIGDFVDFSDK
jgi:hypothetical protein